MRSSAKLKVLVTGAGGQLGRDLVIRLERCGHEVHGFGRAELDVTDMTQVTAVCQSVRPDAIVHSAAYTKVDAAESGPDEAFRINAFGTRNVAWGASVVGAKLVYVSTDYVFDGGATSPIDEFQPASPVNVYGRSKLAGEQFVRQLLARHFIVRTSWVFGPFGGNFVKTMLRLAGERDRIAVVNDQIGCPTYTGDLADCIAAFIETNRYGTYHVSNAGACSWFEFAKAIFAAAQLEVQVDPIPTAAYPYPAKRPLYSVMDPMSLRLNGFPAMRDWKEALAECLAELASVEVRGDSTSS